MKMHALKLFFEHMFPKILGILLIVLGIVGLFLPFLQGIAMILLGLALLGNKTARTKVCVLYTRLTTWWHGKKR